MKFEVYYPIIPHRLNQKWGTYDPKDYSQFGFTRHNGIDVAIGQDSLVRAPFNGTAYQLGNQPNGGGIYLGFLSDDEFQFDAFTCMTPEGVAIEFPAMTARVLFDFLHLKSISATAGMQYKTGDVLAVQDNTGFSTGPHTHIQPRRVSYDGKSIAFLDTNDAHGSFDPTQFFNGFYAIQFPALYSIVKESANITAAVVASPAPVEQKISLLQSLLNALLSLFKGRSTT
jgi:murein DD-endopeptidase MepM/ murein hydrolase activator NlpD